MTSEPRRRIDVGAAEALIGANLRGWGTHQVSLDEAIGEILREPVRSERNQPPFDRVTMDGFACRHAALDHHPRFRVAGTQGAGRDTLTLVNDGDCIAVMTGTALPVGADTVIPVERTQRDGDSVRIEAGYRPNPGQNIHRHGSDHRAGTTLVEAGRLLDATHVGSLCIGGGTTVTVARRPRIAIVSTGDELVEPGAPLGPNQIRQSNDRTLAAALAARGFRVPTRRHLPDDPAVLERELHALLGRHDVLILSGGVSMGEFDHVPGVLTALGARPIFHKVLQRPGLPFWFGVSADQKPVFALPGNPVSSLVCLVRYVAPALITALGATPRSPRLVKLGREVRFEPDLTYFLPVTLDYRSDGECLALPRPANTSGDFAALSGTDGFVELPRGREWFPEGFVASYWKW